MKPEYRTRALDVAHAHLVWLTAQPSPLDAALDVLADVDARTTIAAGSKDGTAHQLSHYELDINDLREHP